MLVYAISTGDLFLDTGEYLGTGYAGRGDAKNDPTKTAIKKTGPLPVGVYKVGTAFEHPNLGPLAMRLIQVLGETYDRSEFFIHADSADHPGEASEGCIVLARALREQVAALQARNPYLIVLASNPQAPEKGV